MSSDGEEDEACGERAHARRRRRVVFAFARVRACTVWAGPMILVAPPQNTGDHMTTSGT